MPDLTKLPEPPVHYYLDRADNSLRAKCWVVRQEEYDKLRAFTVEQQERVEKAEACIEELEAVLNESIEEQCT